MKVNSNEFYVEILADEGMALTQKSIENEDDRMFSEMFCLGKYDSPDNYIEWEKDKAEAFEAERELRRQEEEKETNTEE